MLASGLLAKISAGASNVDTLAVWPTGYVRSNVEEVLLVTDALVGAMADALDTQHDRGLLHRRCGKFVVDRAVGKYLALLDPCREGKKRG